MKKQNNISPIHPVSAVILSLGAVGAVIHLICVYSRILADIINDTAGYAVRLVLSKISSVLPFSFMELLIFSSPLWIGIAACLAVKCAKKGKVYVIRALSAVLSVAAGVYFLFAVSFAPAYRTTSFSEKAGITQREVSAEELYETALIIIDELNSLCDNVSYNNDGASFMPFTLDTLSEELCRSYDALSKDYTFITHFDSRVKPLIISPLMTYSHISGIYSFFTGEANVNTNYPDYVTVFTCAHEMAHQCGIAREDEANFTAFLVCKNADSDYIRYSAYLNMYDYLAGALYSADRDLYSDAYDRLSAGAKSELSAYSAFFDKYRDNVVADVSDTVNNAYLELQGTEGVKSYGLVADLAVSYYLD